MNVFLLDYNTRLRAWHNLREVLKEADTQTICIEVDKFWQRTPINTHYLHPDEIENWLTLWELISDNHYCYYSRALGMAYTLMLLGVKDIDFVEAIGDNKENIVTYKFKECPLNKR